MTTIRLTQLIPFAAAVVVGLALFSTPLSAMMSDPPQASPATAPTDPKAADPKAADPKASGTETKAADPKATETKTPDAKGTDTKAAPAAPDKKSNLDFRNGYRHAYDLIQKGDYVAGIAAMHALGHNENSDVATAIGFASRKLGRYDDAKVWYDRALAANPKNARTWQYYGMWHLEQGNRLKAEDHLQTIRMICGSDDCLEFKTLKEALAGNVSY
jgi:tetratricopeptide (TPR) repeat protein